MTSILLKHKRWWWYLLRHNNDCRFYFWIIFAKIVTISTIHPSWWKLNQWKSSSGNVRFLSPTSNFYLLHLSITCFSLGGFDMDRIYYGKIDQDWLFRHLNESWWCVHKRSGRYVRCLMLQLQKDYEDLLSDELVILILSLSQIQGI